MGEWNLSCREVFDGKSNDYLKIDEDENSEMNLVYCAIHRETLLSKDITSVFNEVLKAVIKSINAIRAVINS